MRPILIAEVALPSSGWTSHLAGGGWLVTRPKVREATVLDPELRVAERIPVPIEGERFEAGVNARHLAAVSRDELVVLDRAGGILWRRKLAGQDHRPNCHLDAPGVLWVHLPAGNELVAYDAATGKEFDRVRLNPPAGVAFFEPHPDGRQVGVSVAAGQVMPVNYLARYSGGRIQGRNLPGGYLAGFTSTGDRYLTMPSDDEWNVTVQDVATGAVTAAGYPEGVTLVEAAALVSDDFLLVGINDDDFATDVEEHLLLATRSLRRQAHLDYRIDMVRNSIAATDGRGRWITDSRDGFLRLWQLPDLLTDEVDGQLGLW